ncbi:MAG TPA: hypothetical protein VFG46_16355 [Chryseolinea sp.]|nr:hypothetical protein [Chryseolinea sp.]
MPSRSPSNTELTLSEPSSRAKGRHELIGRRIPPLRSGYGKKVEVERSAFLHGILRFAQGLHTCLALDGTFFIGAGTEVSFAI